MTRRGLKKRGTRGGKRQGKHSLQAAQVTEETTVKISSEIPTVATRSSEEQRGEEDDLPPSAGGDDSDANNDDDCSDGWDFSPTTSVTADQEEAVVPSSRQKRSRDGDEDDDDDDDGDDLSSQQHDVHKDEHGLEGGRGSAPVDDTNLLLLLRIFVKWFEAHTTQPNNVCTGNANSVMVESGHARWETSPQGRRNRRLDMYSAICHGCVEMVKIETLPTDAPQYKPEKRLQFVSKRIAEVLGEDLPQTLISRLDDRPKSVQCTERQDEMEAFRELMIKALARKPEEGRDETLFPKSHLHSIMLNDHHHHKFKWVKTAKEATAVIEKARAKGYLRKVKNEQYLKAKNYKGARPYQVTRMLIEKRFKEPVVVSERKVTVLTAQDVEREFPEFSTSTTTGHRHPCLSTENGGHCQFGDDCPWTQFPQDACLHFLMRGECALEPEAGGHGRHISRTNTKFFRRHPCLFDPAGCRMPKQKEKECPWAWFPSFACLDNLRNSTGDPEPDQSLSGDQPRRCCRFKEISGCHFAVDSRFQNPNLHPCIRASSLFKHQGRCQGDRCPWARYPRESCLTEIGNKKCESDKCSALHGLLGLQGAGNKEALALYKNPLKPDPAKLLEAEKLRRKKINKDRKKEKNRQNQKKRYEDRKAAAAAAGVKFRKGEELI